MSNWIKNSTHLKGEMVDLIPLNQTHFKELEFLAKDKRIWEFYPLDGSHSETLLTSLAAALIDRDIGSQLPFVIFHKTENTIIGSTRYMDIQPKHRKLEIGWTWLHPDYWASEVNLECKLLLLTHSFETVLASRVQLKTDENNLRSRKAIQKIGGRFEGILRNDMIRDNNTKRNSAYYSIIEEEWPEAKQKLVFLLDRKRKSMIKTLN